MHILLDERAVRPEDLAPARHRFLHIYRNWPRFHDGPRQESKPLHRAFERCQCFGTTALTRSIAGARSFKLLAVMHRDEPGAALALTERSGREREGQRMSERTRNRIEEVEKPSRRECLRFRHGTLAGP